MSEHETRKGGAGQPGGPDANDILRRAASEVRATSALQAFVPLSSAERERVADAAIERALGPAGQSASPAPRFRRRFGARAAVAAVVASLGLAAAVALVLLGGRHTVEPLATYTMVVEGENPERGAVSSGSGSITLRPETRLIIKLSAQKPERDVSVRLVLAR